MKHQIEIDSTGNFTAPSTLSAEQGSRVEASTEIAGQVGALGLATCSLPVSLVQRVAKHLRTASAIADQQASYITAENFREASILLRAHLESAESRQPEENTVHEPHAPKKD